MIGRVGKTKYYTYVDTKLSDNIYMGSREGRGRNNRRRVDSE